jgi:predicted acyltransferase
MRLHFLDAFRALTIYGMILSGSIAQKILPAYMYHAQVPPPLHKFNPSIPGITWVDLVFPFFLLAMGISIPLSLQKKIEHKKNYILMFFQATKRAILLLWFATYIQQIKILSVTKVDMYTCLFFILSLILLSGIFVHWQKWTNAKTAAVIQLTSLLLSVCSIWFLMPAITPIVFNHEKNDIIIVVLANVGFVATILYLVYNYNNKIALALTFFLLLFIVVAKVNLMPPVSKVYNNSFLPFIFRWDFQKYLFIVLPGVAFGHLWLKTKYSLGNKLVNSWQSLANILLIVAATAALFYRDNFFLYTCLGLYILVLALCNKHFTQCEKLFLYLGLSLLLVGLCLEPLQGGIKKDSATFSYFFVTAGLGFIMLHSLYVWQVYYNIKYNLITRVGANSLGSYEMGKLLIIPLLYVIGLYTPWLLMHYTAWQGFARGLVYTTLACAAAHVMQKLYLGWKA